MPLEVLSVSCMVVLSVPALEVGTVTFDIVKHVLMPAQELGGVSLEEFDGPGYLGATIEDGVLAEKFARVVERLQLGKSLIVANPQFCHICYLLRGRRFIKHFVELLH